MPLPRRYFFRRKRMKLRVISIDGDGNIRLAADGPLTAAGFANNENPLATALGENWASHRILIDLSAVEQLDSTAIGWLISARAALGENSGLLVLHSMHPHVRQILQTLRV